MTKWTTADIPSQAGRTVIITGATSGLGRVSAEALAATGARVVMAVRDLDKGRRTAAEIDGLVEVRQLDLADLASVRSFAHGWHGPIDVLVNNAGVMAVEQRRTTADGFEMQFGTNHLGHFALTNLLLPRITDRVVTVSSTGHRMGTIVLDDLNWERRSYKPWPAYGQTKLANLLFTAELERRLQVDGSAVRTMAAHPGFAATDLFRSDRRVVQWVGTNVISRIAQSAEMGALPQLFAATADLPGNSYVGPDGFKEQRGYPTLVGRSAEACDAQLARDLWTASERLTGVGYPAGLGQAA